jgi:hypothetical protein
MRRAEAFHERSSQRTTGASTRRCRKRGLIVFRPILKASRHRTGRIAATVSDIEVDAIASAGHRISAGLVTRIPIVPVFFIVAATGTVMMLIGVLVLRRKKAIRIAQAIAGAEIPTITARRRMSGNTILDLFNRSLRPGSGRKRRASESQDDREYSCDHWSVSNTRPRVQKTG